MIYKPFLFETLGSTVHVQKYINSTLTTFFKYIMATSCAITQICPVTPVLPEQGGIMPVLWQPIAQTNLNLDATQTAAVYTLNVITTQTIDKGVLFRFQMWNGLSTTYDEAVSSSVIAEFDLVVLREIPPATVLVVKMTPSSTGLYGFTGTVTYAQNGKGVPAAFFTAGSSLLAFAFVPTSSGGWAPARGRPMFAIGFSVPDRTQVLSCCLDGYASSTSYPGPGISPTAPNFPDQWSGSVVSWIFDYEVTYPFLADNPGDAFGTDCCIQVPGIKIQSQSPLYIKGSWANLRDQIAQPWTVIKDNFYSTSRWQTYLTIEDADVTAPMTPDVGPFVLAAMPGQLVVVYFRPRYKDISTDSSGVANRGQSFTYRDSGSAEIAFLVTAPLQPNQTIYFTHEAYNQALGGFGPRHASTGSAAFVVHNPSFVWTTGCSVIPAGTVVIIRRIGQAAPSNIVIHDAHDTGADVGSITQVITNFGAGTAIVSLIAVSTWVQQFIGSARPIAAGSFITAALSDQYAGDFPPLSPGLTISSTRFTGTNIYGAGKVFDNGGLPGTVQCSLINSANFTAIPNNEPVNAKELPAFLNMCGVF